MSEPNDGVTVLREIADKLEQDRVWVGELVHACKDLMAGYDAMPDGPLGKGLVNGHFLRIRHVLGRLEGDDTELEEESDE